MDKEKLFKLKKYIFFLSLFFLVLIGSHLAYLYLYDDAKKIPVEWWAVSEWIIWSFPNLNPLLANNDYNRFVVSLLYRSLISYNTRSGEIAWDLAKCNISELDYIECSLKDNLKWSNWTNISIEDIIATYNILKNTDINPQISSILQNVTIEEKNGSIVFKNKTKDVKFLNILFQPILSKQVLDNIWNKELFGNFGTENWIYSGPYVVDNRTQDENSWVEKLNLIKNSNFSWDKTYISKVSIRFFADNLELIKNKDKLNAFNDTDNIIWNSMPRLYENKYILSQYTSVFLNKERLTDIKLRNFIIDKIDRDSIVKVLWDSNYKAVKNPFLTNYSIDTEPKDKNIVSILKINWFYKKSELVENILSSENKKQTDEITKMVDTPTKYVSSTDKTIKKYTFTSKRNILLKWIVNDDKVEAVYINENKLQSFKTWDKDFYYRLSTDASYKTLKEWKNTYLVYFEKDWKKVLKETFTIFYNKDSKLLSKERDDFIKSMTNTWTWTQVNANLSKELQTKIDKIKLLDDRYFYDKDLKKFQINLDYIWLQKENKIVASQIKNEMETYWILVNLREIWSIKLLNEKITNWNKDYDMILVWVNLWSFDFNLFDYFHSSQAKNAYNFSNVKRIDLDIALENLKSNIQNKTQADALKREVLDILKKEQIIKTIESPYIKYLVDKNIKNLKVPEKIPDTSYRFESFQDAYILENKEINWWGKSIIWFFENIINTFKNN